MQIQREIKEKMERKTLMNWLNRIHCLREQNHSVISLDLGLCICLSRFVSVSLSFSFLGHSLLSIAPLVRLADTVCHSPSLRSQVSMETCVTVEREKPCLQSRHNTHTHTQHAYK